MATVTIKSGQAIFGAVGLGAIKLEKVKLSDGTTWEFTGMMAGPIVSATLSLAVVGGKLPGYSHMSGWCMCETETVTSPLVQSCSTATIFTVRSRASPS